VPTQPNSAPRDPPPTVEWPHGKDFAFTVFDDTDLSTLRNAGPVYELLGELGFRTTKSVWPLRGSQAESSGATCEDDAYREWVQALQRQGFEIALHNVASNSSPREQTIRGIERFRELFGQYPSAHTNHGNCRENIYWNNCRLSDVNEVAYNLMNRFRTLATSEGHVESSRFYWGDVCRDRITYVRNFVHGNINTLGYCPEMPYHDPHRPYVNNWFASTEGANVDAFAATISERNQDRLEAEGGACIMYTHFWSFASEGRADARFERLMRRLSTKNGWFVPVTTLLDHLLQAKGRHEITSAERDRLERQWLLYKAHSASRSRIRFRSANGPGPDRSGEGRPRARS
jgi:hypothetical protein